MKLLRTITGNDTAFLTSIEPKVCRSKCCASYRLEGMEGSSCIEVMNENVSQLSDSCRTASLNGRIKSVPTDGSSSDDSRVGINATSDEGFATVLNVVNSSEYRQISEKGRRDDGDDHERIAVSKTMIEFSLCRNSHVSLPSCGNTDCNYDCSTQYEDSRGADSTVDVLCNHKNSSSPESEICLTLSPLAVSSEVPSSETCGKSSGDGSDIRYIIYESEQQMTDIMKLITKDLSEPYSIYTYRYFIHNWPKLCYLAMDGDKCVGAIVCKLDRHRSTARRGYIAMLAVDQDYRRSGIGSNLVVQAIRSMTNPTNGGCDEVVLETEISNGAALRLYEKLGFVRDKRLFRYYLNGVDALRLKLWLK